MKNALKDNSVSNNEISLFQMFYYIYNVIGEVIVGHWKARAVAALRRARVAYEKSATCFTVFIRFLWTVIPIFVPFKATDGATLAHTRF